jgi:DNA polymerase-3 subunit delta'
MIESGNHIDIIRVKAGASKNSTVQSVRDNDIENLISRLNTKPYEADRNIAVIEDADTMSRKAANRLLKTLEEPPLGTVIMILSENITDLPVTIRSRCVHLRVLADDAKQNDLAEKTAGFVDLLTSRGSYISLKRTIEKIGKDRDKAFIFLDSLEDEYRKRLLDMDSSIKKEVIFKAVDEIEKTRKKIKGNVTVQYALKALTLNLGG